MRSLVANEQVASSVYIVHSQYVACFAMALFCCGLTMAMKAIISLLVWQSAVSSSSSVVVNDR